MNIEVEALVRSLKVPFYQDKLKLKYFKVKVFYIYK